MSRRLFPPRPTGRSTPNAGLRRKGVQGGTGSGIAGADTGSDERKPAITVTYEIGGERARLVEEISLRKGNCAHEMFLPRGRSHLSLDWMWRNERWAFLTEV
ncbi:MAG: hypothetical protein P8182_04310 [Deltaproteobacteria bacterium]